MSGPLPLGRRAELDREPVPTGGELREAAWSLVCVNISYSERSSSWYAITHLREKSNMMVMMRHTMEMERPILDTICNGWLFDCNNNKDNNNNSNNEEKTCEGISLQ